MPTASDGPARSKWFLMGIGVASILAGLTFIWDSVQDKAWTSFTARELAVPSGRTVGLLWLTIGMAALATSAILFLIANRRQRRQKAKSEVETIQLPSAAQLSKPPQGAVDTSLDS